MESEVMLTTFDNPFDPFKQFASWYLFDVEKGYNTCSYLGRIVRLSDDMTEKETDAEVERAIDAIIEHDFMNIYKKVRKNDKKDGNNVETAQKSTENQQTTTDSNTNT